MSKEKKINPLIIHAIIGVAIMFLFPLLPIPYPEGTVTAAGEQVLGIFIGTLYLWTTVDPLWASLLSAGAFGITSYSSMSAILVSWWGNAVVVQMFFIMVGVGALTHEGVTDYIGRFFMTRKFAFGKPWLFTSMILIGCYVMSVFIGAFNPILLFWPVMYGVFRQLGYTNQDKYPKIVLILIVVAALFGFPVPPYMSNGLALLSNYRGIAANAGVEIDINNGKYFITCFIMGAVMLAIVILFSKFVLRPDVSKIEKLTPEFFEKNPLPPMNLRQKILLITYFAYVLLMLVPSLLTSIPLMQWLNNHSLGWALLYVAILGAVILSDGRPVIDFPAIMSNRRVFPWATFWLCCTAIMIGSLLTSEGTGVSALLATVLSPIFNGMGTTTFTIVLLLVAFVLTNLCNSLVIGMILQPVILTYCTATGVNAAPIVTLLIFFVLLSAMCTPAASPFAAMMFSNKDWLKSTDVYKYAGMYAIISLVFVLVVGIPFANLMM